MMSLKIISGYASKLANTLCSPDISSILTRNKETKDDSLPHFLWKPIVYPILDIEDRTLCLKHANYLHKESSELGSRY